jgi:hypothetical protein
MTTAPAATRPADYRIALPDGWFRIDVRPGRRKRAVQALLNRQFRGIGNAPDLRRQLQDQLMAMAQTAYAGGGIEIYLCQQDILGVPIPASLVISLTPPPPDGRTVTPQQLAATLAGDREVSLTALPAGTAVRTRRRTVPPQDDPSGNILPVTNLDLYVPVPASGSYLVLAFSTNLDPLAASMVSLFDAIAGTLEWLP